MLFKYDKEKYSFLNVYKELGYEVSILKEYANNLVSYR